MLSRNRKDVPSSKSMEFSQQGILLVAVHLVDSKKERLAGARQESRQLAIGPCNLSTSIDDHNNRCRFFECDLGLTKDLRRNEILIVGNDAARIHHSKLVPAPFPLAVEAAAGDPRPVAADRPPRYAPTALQPRFAHPRAVDAGG